MKTNISINGENFDVEISEQTKDLLIEQFRQMDKLLKAIEKPKKTGYERVDLGEEYFTEEDGKVYNFEEDFRGNSDQSYEAANYYSDETIAENNARADMLLRKLRRFAVEHREEELDWGTYDSKYCIYYWYTENKIKVTTVETCRDFAQIYFDSKETANAAIEEFKDELIWYFTEYKDSL